MSEKTPKSFTRRTFLTAGGFFITSMALPVIDQAGEKGAAGADAGAASNLPTAFAPTIAYAKDSEATFEVVVTSESTVVFKVVDVAQLGSDDSAKDLPAVNGAQVSAYDAASNKTYSATADAHGYAYIDISEGTKRCEDTSRPAYSTTLQVGVTCAGHRDVIIQSMRVKGATAYTLPCPTKKDEKAYFRAIGFNGQDVQYSKASFLHSVANDAEHTLSAQVYLADGEPEGAAVRFYRWRSSSKTFPGAGGEGVTTVGTVNLDATKAVSSNAQDVNFYKAELKGRFLLNGYSLAFEAGDRLVASVVRGKTEYLVVTLAEFKKAPFDNTGTGNLSTLPGVSLVGGNSFKVPDKVPVLGGDTFSWWEPSSIFTFYASPFGYIKLGVSLGSLGTSTDSNPFNLSSWKEYSFESAEEERKYLMDGFNKRMDKVMALNDKRTAPDSKGLDKYFNSEILPKFTVGIGVSVSVDATYDWLGDKSWKLGLGGALSLMGEALYDIQMMIGPVPVFVSFSLGLAFTLAAKVGGVTYWPDGDDSFDDKITKFFSGMTLDWKNTQAAFTIAFSVSLTGGVGVAGVATIGLRYASSLTLYIGFYEAAKGLGDGTNQYPHTMVIMDMSLSIAIQFLLFKYNKTLWSLTGDARKLYDSWKSEATTASIEEAAIAALSDDSVPDDGNSGTVVVDENGNYYMSLETLAKNATEVTDEELAGAREFSTGTAQAATTAALGEESEEAQKLVSMAHQDGSGIYTMCCGNGEQIAATRKALGYEDEAVPGEEAVPSDDVPADAAVAAQSNDAQVSGATVPEYTYPDTGITVDEGSYAGEKFLSGDAAFSSISGIAEDGGVSVDSGKFLTNVFSDGRPKFVELNGVLTMFRIAAVNCNGSMRTRLVVQRKQDGTWGKPAPIDFDPKGISDLHRDDLYDYDFDIAPVKLDGDGAGAQVDVVVLLFSGTRNYEENAKDTYARVEASSGQHVSTIIDYGYNGSDFGVKTSFSWRTFADAASYGNNQIFAFMPRVNVEVQTTNPLIFDLPISFHTVFVTCAYAYKHQTKGGKTSILSSDVSTDVAAATTAFISKTGASGDVPQVVLPITNVAGGVFDSFEGDVVYLTNGPTSAKSLDANIARVEYEWGSYFGVQVQRKNAKGSSERAFGVLKVAAHCVAPLMTATVPPVLSYTPSIFYQPDSAVKRLVPWPTQDAMIAIKATTDAAGQNHNVAYRMEFDLSGQGGSFPAGTQIGPSTGLPMDFMVTNNGKTLLYSDNQSSKNKIKTDAQGNPVLGDDGLPVTEAAQGSFYRIMAMKVIKDGEKVALSKPFSACALNHAVDSVVAVAADHEATDIIALEVADIDKSLANYWEIEVPCIACATPTDISATDGMVIAGQPCTFEVALRNDGNTILRGTELRLVDGETGAVLYDNMKIEFNAQTVVASSDMKAATDDPAGTDQVKFETGYEALGDHMLAKDGGRNMLAPGRSARVCAQITVPADWKQKHKVVVKTCKLTYIDPITSEENTTASLASLDEKTGYYTYMAGVSGIAGLGDGETGETFGAQGDDVYVDVELGTAAGSGENLGYSEAVVLSSGDGGSDGGSDGSGDDDGSGSGGSGSGKKKGTPETGDAAFDGVAGLATAALGVIGVGMAAYSNRRLEVEREEADR